MNVLWGFFNLAVGYLLVCRVGSFELRQTRHVVVLGMGIFHRPPGAVRRDGKPWLRNLLTEYFTIQGGRITGIYAVMHYMEPAAPDTSGWPDQDR